MRAARFGKAATVFLGDGPSLQAHLLSATVTTNALPSPAHTPSRIWDIPVTKSPTTGAEQYAAAIGKRSRKARRRLALRDANA